jgi:4-hydroxyacetophenone monooxygenase
MLRDNGVWAATLKRANVELVTAPIAEITPTGVRTNDEIERAADVLIYATGFLASDFYGPIRILGVDGQDLQRVWDGDARAYLGGCVPGFPNLFSLFGPNTALVINGSIFFMSECASNYVIECLRLMLKGDCEAMECRPEAYESFAAEVDAGNAQMAWGGISTVNSWYRNKYGRASQAWPFPLAEYWSRTRRPDLSAFLLTSRTNQRQITELCATTD